MKTLYLLLIATTVLGLGQNANAKIIGACKFDTQASSFAGSPMDQASCLLRKVKVLGSVDQSPAKIPANLSSLIGSSPPISKEDLRSFLASKSMSEASVGGPLDHGLSHGNDNGGSAPQARYFVIHDTSTPNFGSQPFPNDIDTSAAVNSFNGYRSPTSAAAHAFVNRKGEIYIGHDFGIPWRATKLENQIGTPAKGLFIHIENIQPRRKHPQQADGTAPVPGLSPSQYDTLALLYLVSSVRAGHGLVPAFHAAIDQGISDGHDDPQNFELADFDAALGRVLDTIKK